MAMKPLAPMLTKLDDGYDIVTYGTHTQKDIADADCGDNWSSNWHAGRKGNAVSAQWWKNVKVQLTRDCQANGMDPKDRGACCHTTNHAEDPHQCHIPFGSIERMKSYTQFTNHKTPAMIGPFEKPVEAFPPPSPPRSNRESARERWWGAPSVFSRGGSLLPSVHADARAVLMPALFRRLPEAITPKIWCLNGDHNMIPHTNGEVYWLPWNVKEQRTAHNQHFVLPNYKVNCTEVDNGNEAHDLDCGPVPTKRMVIPPRILRSFFGRTVYHLFFSAGFHGGAMRSGKFKEPKDVLHKSWLLSELFRRSLGYVDGATGHKNLKHMADKIEYHAP